MNPQMINALLLNLELAVTTGTIAQVVREDLEAVVHNTLWQPQSPNQLVLSKMLPSLAAKKTKHEFTRLTSYGSSGNRGRGYFTETSLPPTSTHGFDRAYVNVKLLGTIAPTFMLAEYEAQLEVHGTTSPATAQAESARRDLLRKIEREMIIADDRTVRDGENGVVMRGIIQQIEQGTDGTLGIYGLDGASNVIDMEGEPLTPDTIRQKMAAAFDVFGVFNTLVMPPKVRAGFEQSLDGAVRLGYPAPLQAMNLGQYTAGVMSNGLFVKFHTSQDIGVGYLHPKYEAVVEDGAPTTLPTGTAAAVAGGGTSKWDARSAGNVFYVVTEVKAGREGLGRRIPASGFLAVAAGQKVQITLTAGDAGSDSFRIYRGDDQTSPSGLTTDAQHIFDVAHTAAGAAQVVEDVNKWRHGHEIVLGLRLASAAQQSMASSASYDEAWAKRAEFFGMADDPTQNTVTMVHLGPKMAEFDLPKNLFQARNPLLATAMAVQVRNPRQNLVFINVAPNFEA